MTFSCHFMKRGTAKTTLVILSFVIIGIILGFSLASYAEKDPANLVCEDNFCKQSLHYTARVELRICGEQLPLPTNKGSREKAHTESDPYTIHWYERTYVDKETLEPLDKSELYLGEFFENIGVDFTPSCIIGYCNDDSCGETKGFLKMYVNGKRNYDLGNYIWDDRDKIIIEFK